MGTAGEEGTLGSGQVGVGQSGWRRGQWRVAGTGSPVDHARILHPAPKRYPAPSTQPRVEGGASLWELAITAPTLANDPLAQWLSLTSFFLAYESENKCAPAGVAWSWLQATGQVRSAPCAPYLWGAGEVALPSSITGTEAEPQEHIQGLCPLVPAHIPLGSDRNKGTVGGTEIRRGKGCGANPSVGVKN